MRQADPGKDFGLVGFRERAADEHRESTGVVIADEGRQGARLGRAAFVQWIAEEQSLPPFGALLARERLERSGTEGEVEHRRIFVDPRVDRQRARLHRILIDFAEDVEIGNSARFRPGLHGGDERLPEFGIDVLGGIDPETVDAEPVNPASEHLDQSSDDPRVLSIEIVESGEIAIGRAFAIPFTVAAIVVPDRVVEPGRNLDAFFGLGNRHLIGKIRVGEARIIGGTAIAVAVEAGIDRRTVGPAATLIRIVCDRAVAACLDRAALILNHVCSVIGDDVHIDLHATRMRRIDQGLEVGIGAEMRINLGEIGHPIAVITGRFLARRTLHRLVLENRRDPDGGDAHALQIINPAK